MREFVRRRSRRRWVSELRRRATTLSAIRDWCTMWTQIASLKLHRRPVLLVFLGREQVWADTPRGKKIQPGPDYLQPSKLLRTGWRQDPLAFSIKTIMDRARTVETVRGAQFWFIHVEIFPSWNDSWPSFLHRRLTCMHTSTYGRVELYEIKFPDEIRKVLSTNFLQLD